MSELSDKKIELISQVIRDSYDALPDPSDSGSIFAGATIMGTTLDAVETIIAATADELASVSL